jgi:hypothetical protein
MRDVGFFGTVSPTEDGEHQKIHGVFNGKTHHSIVTGVFLMEKNHSMEINSKLQLVFLGFRVPVIWPWDVNLGMSGQVADDVLPETLWATAQEANGHVRR